MSPPPSDCTPACAPDGTPACTPGCIPALLHVLLQALQSALLPALAIALLQALLVALLVAYMASNRQPLACGLLWQQQQSLHRRHRDALAGALPLWAVDAWEGEGGGQPKASAMVQLPG